LPDAAGRGASVSRSDIDRRFPRRHRLTSRRQFLAVYGQGRRASCSSFTLFATPNDVGVCRLGLTVTRKVGGAVQRNRVKRVFREIFRRNRARLEPAFDLVINVHPSIVNRPSAELERQFLSCFARLGRKGSRRQGAGDDRCGTRRGTR
jgi:ribonuclease P protein component